jgi:hypothetical protein
MQKAYPLRKVLSIFLITAALLLGSLLTSGNQMQALAKPLTPDVAAYEIDHVDNAQAAGREIQAESENHKKEINNGPAPAKDAAKDAVEGTGNAFQRVADNVREKLNLDEPVPQSTKDFLNEGKKAIGAPTD